MGQSFATCGHDITSYPWDYPGVWTQGFHDGGVGPNAPWSFSTLCFDCIMSIMQQKDCVVQFSDPNALDAKVTEEMSCACGGGNCQCGR